jgi:hypothetical protein
MSGGPPPFPHASVTTSKYIAQVEPILEMPDEGKLQLVNSSAGSETRE